MEGEIEGEWKKNGLTSLFFSVTEAPLETKYFTTST